MARGGHIGWQRVLILTIIGATATITADYLGLVDWLAGMIGDG